MTAETDIGPGQVNVVFRVDTFGEVPQGMGANLELRTDAVTAEAFSRGRRYQVYFVPDEMGIVPEWRAR